MNLVDDACKHLAKLIYKNGQRILGKNEGCLNPDLKSEYGKLSKILWRKFKATHFTRYWNEDQRHVHINLYSGDSFGACLTLGSVVHSATFHIDELGE